ncbi:20858_t:CDS:1, partial [Cetraspora pellucida]
MNFLPTELLHSIFTLLGNDQKSLSHASKVCRQWRAIVLPLIYYRPQFKDINGFRKFLRISYTSGSLVREVNLSHLPHRWTAITDPDIIHLVNLCPNLTFLDINQCSALQDSTLAHIASILGSHLTTLIVSQCPKFTDKGFIALARSCKALTSLDFSFTDITDKALSEIAVTCPTIRWINLINCVGVTELSLDELKKWCKELKVLRLDGCYGILGEVECDDEIW